MVKFREGAPLSPSAFSPRARPLRRGDHARADSRYVETADAAVKLDVASALARLRELEKERAEAEARMNGYLKELGYED